MRALTADLFISLDGFASGVKQAAYFGYFGQNLGDWVHEQLAQPQVIVMGRVTYSVLAQISASSADQLSVTMSNTPKLVFSSTLKEPLAWKNTRLMKGGRRGRDAGAQRAVRRSTAIDGQHQPGEEHDAARARRPSSAHCISLDPWRRWQRADLCRLSARESRSH